MIYTFYSYKGGVGRSMALANVAYCIARLGVRVVMVDWDLEAPGLESFFFDSEPELEAVRTELGVVDLLTTYKREFSIISAGSTDSADSAERARILRRELAPLDPMLVRISQPEIPGRGELLLLPAGWRAGGRFEDYARLVQGFNWEEFYADYWGEAYFNWLSDQLTSRHQDREIPTVVLVDSRTGVTEMGGVCTRQLADVVVLFTAPNRQNLAGVSRMANSFKRDELTKARGGRRLEVTLVPTRIDVAEITARNLFEAEFKAAVDGMMPITLRRRIRSFWDLNIPYVPSYAYEEKLAVGKDDDVDAAAELVTAYETLASTLLELASPKVPRGLGGSSVRGQIGFPEAVQDAPVVWSVPYADNPNFVGRTGELVGLELILNGSSRQPGVVTVVGAGGVGKTAFVARYVHQHRSDFDVVWWCRATGADSLARDMGELAVALNHPPHMDAALNWLQRNGRWLLVFDEVAEPRDLEGVLPTAGAGQVIVISRQAAAWRTLGDVMTLPMLATSDATEYLARRLGVASDGADVHALAEALGGVPLALDNAATFIESSGVDPAEYLARISDPDSPAAESQRPAFAALWRSLSDGPRSREIVDVLRMYAQFGSGGVPLDLLEAPNVLTAETVKSAVRQLTQAGLGQESGGVLRLHPLVRLSIPSQSADAESLGPVAVRRVESLYPVEVDHRSAWPECGRLTPYALEAARRAPGHSTPTLGDLLPRVARYLRIHGKFDQAQEALAMLPPTSSEHHRRAAELERGFLAFELGRPADAVQVFEGLVRAPAVDPGLLGEALTGLGAAWHEMGDYAKAVSTLQQAVALSPGAVDLALLYLARAQWRLGQLAEATQALEQARTGAETLWGPDHPRLAAVLGDLAIVRGAAGDALAAMQLAREAQQIVVQSFDAFHPAVARAMQVRAVVSMREDDPEDALALLEQAKAVYELAYGPNHPEVGRVDGLLGIAWRDLGDETGARKALVRALGVFRHTYGDDHPAAAATEQALDLLASEMEKIRRVDAALRRGLVGDLLVLLDETDVPRPRRRVDAGRALRAIDQPVQAAQVFQDLLASAPHDGRLLLELAGAQDQLGDDVGAEGNLRRAAEVLRGDPGADALVGRVDAVRWRLRWQRLSSVEARQEAAREWSDLAVQAKRSFERAFEADPQDFVAGVDALGLDFLLDDLGVPAESVVGLIERVGGAITAARTAVTPGGPRTDRQKRRWLRTSAAQAELHLLLNDGPQAARTYRSLVNDENVGVLDLAAAQTRLLVYELLDFRSPIVEAAAAAVAQAWPVVTGAPVRTFERVAVVLGHTDVHIVPPDASIGPSHVDLHDLVICAGVSAAEVLIAEAALEIGAAVRLLLPADVSTSGAEVGRRAGPVMAERFVAMLPKCDVAFQADRLGPVSGEAAYRRSQRWCLETGWVEAGKGLTVYFYGRASQDLLEKATALGARVVRSELY